MSDEFTGDSNHAKDLLNQFVWSFEKYFMRDENSYYILFALPVSIGNQLV